MILRYRPSVMVSSSIRGLEDARRSIRDAIESLGVADSWLFEFNAVASGSGPAAQYLEKAKNCDLFVLVIGSSVRSGTEEEYAEAYRDNPSKILPVLLDADTDADAASSFRSQIRDRHNYRTASSVTLPAEVAQAVEHAVRTGAVSRRPLRDAIAAQRTALRSLLSLPGGYTFEQNATIDGAPRPVAALLDGGGRVVLAGEPGAGKSDAALGALLAAASTRLPVLCRARVGATLIDLIEAAFDGVRYTPGTSGIRQLLRDGRLAIVVDGADELRGGDRASLLGEVAKDLVRYPRTPAVLVIRSTSHPAFDGWPRATIQPLDDGEVERLFDMEGHAGEQRIALFAKLGDLIHLPFWAPAIARFGLSAASAPELLDAVIDSRLGVAVPEDAVGRDRLQHALGYLAWGMRPTVDADTRSALDAVTSWANEPATRTRYAAQPAEAILELAQSSGLLVADAGRLRFVHPLVAAQLAARHLVGLDTLPALGEDDDMRSLIAAQLPPERNTEWLDVVSATSPAVLYRALLLAGLRHRASDLPTDAVRFDLAYQRLAPLGGQVVAKSAEGTTTWVLQHGRTICLRRSPGSSVTVGGDVGDWFREASRIRFTCWVRNPFETRSPEQLAAEYVLRGLKDAWRSIDPGGSPFAPHRSDPASLLNPRETLPDRLLAHVVAVADARAHLIEASGLSTWLSPWRGQPAITVTAALPDPRYVVTWGEATPRVAVDDAPGDRGRALTSMLADPEAVAYRDLTDEVDGMLGRTLRSGSVRGPVPMDWIL